MDSAPYHFLDPIMRFMLRWLVYSPLLETKALKEHCACVQLRYSDLKPSDAVLADKRAYHAKLKGEPATDTKKRE